MSYVKNINRLIAALVVTGGLWFQQNAFGIECPCDIYEETGTPCVAAYSTTRLLSGKYEGPLYQVKRADGQTKDITTTEDGFADASIQDDFLGSQNGTISKLYDQSGNGNVLTVAKKGSYTGTASQNDRESNAKGRKLKIAGHNVYGLYMVPQDGYRTNQEGYSGYPADAGAAKNVPKGNAAQGIYAVVDGKRPGNHCCWDFGNASTNNDHGPTGQMNTLFFGSTPSWWGWGKGGGGGDGPWFMNDMEAGVWAGGSGASNVTTNSNPKVTWEFAFGISKTSTDGGRAKYCLRVADAVAGQPNSNIVTGWDGDAPSTWKMEGGILLGIGGDNSNSSFGTFFEGCVTAGRPSDAVDARILKNVQDAHYGSDVPVATSLDVRKAGISNSFTVGYAPSTTSAIIRYSLESGCDVNMHVFNQQGRQIAKIASGMKPAGKHESIWNTSKAAPGVYVVKTAINGTTGWTDKIIVGK
ncbi:MAG: hypothetical protein JW863_17000 [Chitinispirillaceae bacterium]|nr:hypothetical protein [Chitinispirillaceae bacterium]